MTAVAARQRPPRSEAQILEDRIARLRRKCGGPTDGTHLRVLLANALLDANYREDALAELRWSLKFDPLNIAAMRMMGMTMVKMGSVDRAVKLFEKAITLAVARENVPAARELKIFLRRLKR
jgi:Flp pilus assembly protein TadD